VLRLLNVEIWPIGFWGFECMWILLEYYKIYWNWYCHQLIFSNQLTTNELMAISIPIKFTKFWRYLDRFRTSKFGGSSLNIKKSEHMVLQPFSLECGKLVFFLKWHATLRPNWALPGNLRSHDHNLQAVTCLMPVAPNLQILHYRHS
jgi:hypothetical protein